MMDVTTSISKALWMLAMGIAVVRFHVTLVLRRLFSLRIQMV